VKRAISRAKQDKFPLTLTFVDLRNAFGSVDIEVLDHCLAFLEVPEAFCGMVRDLHANLRMWFRQITPNPKEDEYVDLEIGVRQGSPLSPLLWDCVVEPLIRWLDFEDFGAVIDGVRIPGLFYADDGCLLEGMRVQESLDCLNSYLSHLMFSRKILQRLLASRIVMDCYHWTKISFFKG